MNEITRTVIRRVVQRHLRPEWELTPKRSAVLLALCREPEASEITLAEADEAITLLLRNVQ